MEDYSTTKTNGILLFVTWMEDIMSGEISHTQRSPEVPSHPRKLEEGSQKHVAFKVE
jgi:hypothetical protein